MRDRMERLVVLPFSVGCISDSSVDVLSPLSKHHHHSPQGIRDQEEEENMKNVFKFLAVSKPEISTAYKEEEESEEGETSGLMEIGAPTNVKHVSHIGWESSREWKDLIPPELLAAAAAKEDAAAGVAHLQPTL
ncbi:CRIB domain-containing protein RIC4 isoform X2 [Brassica napus]|uniref:CRIB domain-containing protein RIC4 isoform X2 n=1 Tax=Brassica napus TaxID=3708 RepID=UPI002079CCCB|nr:CRIB domain-containing protein RIC4 isoform X2 [Brassica napus]